MKRPLKAALFSALLFPGSGYLLLDKLKQASIFISLTLMGLGMITYQSIYKAKLISQKIISGDVSSDLTSISRELENLPGIINPDLLDIMGIIIIILWVVGTVDCYRIGKQQEHEKK